MFTAALGSTPLLSYHDFGDKLNVTCVSGGWSPKPTLTWRDGAGQELPSSHIDYKTGTAVDLMKKPPRNRDLA